MGCDSDVSTNAFSFVAGSDVALNVQLTTQDPNACAGSCAIPFALPNFTSCSVKLLNADGTFLSVAGSLVSADLGKLTFALTATQTALLAVGINNFEVTVIQSTGRTIVVLPKAVNIIATIDA